MTFDPHKPARTRDGRLVEYLGPNPASNRLSHHPRYPHWFKVYAPDVPGGVFTISVTGEGRLFQIPGSDSPLDLHNYTPEPTSTPQPPAFDPTKPVQTRDGRKARILCTDRRALGMSADYPIVALVEDYSGDEQGASYTAEGRKFKFPAPLEPRDSDLINVPEERTVWLVSYINKFGAVQHEVSEGKDFALAYAREHGVQTLALIPVTYKEGQGLPPADPK